MVTFAIIQIIVTTLMPAKTADHPIGASEVFEAVG